MTDKEIKYSGAWKVCEDCGCVLYLEYPSPVCPACEAKRELTESDMAEVEKKLAKALGAEIVVPTFKAEKESKGK